AEPPRRHCLQISRSSSRRLTARPGRPSLSSMRHPSRTTSGVIEVTMIEDQSTAALLDGRYRIHECVGRGGTAVVYRAEDTALGRTVAIKMLRRPEEMPIALERAHGESALLATVSHPSLITLYDARLAPGHPQYLTMEYVHGPTLAARLSRGPLTSQEAAGLAHDIALGLQAVHDAGI